MSVCCECCVLSGRGLCDGLITRPEESYRVWCVWVWSWSVEKWGGLGPKGAVEPGRKTWSSFPSQLLWFINCSFICVLHRVEVVKVTHVSEQITSFFTVKSSTGSYETSVTIAVSTKRDIQKIT
jgi:hypothetical protein